MRFLLPLCLAVSLCACAPSERQTCYLSPFTGDVSYSFNGKDYLTRVTYESPDRIEVNVLQPAALQGLTAQKSGRETALTFLGIALQTDDLSLLPLPEAGLLSLLRCLAAVGEQTLQADRDGVVTGVLGDMTYELRLDPDSGVPLRLSTDDFTCSFVNTTRLIS